MRAKADAGDKKYSKDFSQYWRWTFAINSSIVLCLGSGRHGWLFCLHGWLDRPHDDVEVTE